MIWGGGEPEFETQDEMRIVLGTIMGRYNEIAACFDGDPDEFDPIFWEGPEGEVIASDWAGGFLDAVALRTQAWRPLIEDDRAGILLAPLFLLNGDMSSMIAQSMSTNCWQRHRTCFRPASRVFMSSGRVFGGRRLAEVAAGQDAADVSDTTIGIDRQHGGSGRHSHRQG